MSDDYEVFETDIAIVGMAARLPGAPDVDTYWKNLAGGVESIRSFTDEELLAAGESPEMLGRKNYVRVAAPIEGMELFDGEFFGFSPKECAILDPQHRHFLECAWEALEHAGHPPEKFEGPIGLYAGCGMGSYFYFNLCTNPDLVREVGMFLLRHTGNDKDFLATRVSYLLNLRGPTIGVQTACSTSLVAVHLASQSLISRECDMALAGGVTIELPHRRGYLYQEGEILSPTGHCHAFDHRAQGTVFGSGAGVVVLRRLEDALDDGDVIHAVIRGSAVNNDGSSKVNYLAPSVDGQAACMVEAYGIAQVDPRTIEYIECHGTGTYLGDPIEIEALTQAFRASTQDRGFCRIGSVKTNIGHLDTAAGVASLIKATLALEHGQIPPTLNFERPNPTLDLERTPFEVADRLEPWPTPKGHPRRAAVNSLGVGGTNAHVVLQEPPARPESDPPSRQSQLLTLSAKSAHSLDEGCVRLAAHLRAHPELTLADVAYTLHHGRREMEKRRVLAASSVDEAVQILEDRDPRRIFTHQAHERASTVFMFPGGGAQYVEMGADLYREEPVFREHLDRGLALLREAHGIDLEPLLFPAPERREEAERRLEEMPHQLPAIFIVSYAMAKLLESRGLKPAAAIGHSLGENTAACLAGVISFPDCLGLVVLRGRLLGQVDEGAMLSISLPAAEVESLLGEALDLSVVNGPEATVVSGPPHAIDSLARALSEREDVEARRLAVPVAAHSRMLDPILEEFRAYLESVRLSKPTLPFVSNRTGTWITDAQAVDPGYWVDHLRHTVRFGDGVATLLETSGRVLIECGPGRILSSLARQQPSATGSAQVFPCMRHPDEVVDDLTFFTATLGRAWASGLEIDWEAFWPGESRQKVVLPTYAFQHKRYFIEPGRVEVAERGVDLPRIEELERFGSRPVWRPSVIEAEPTGERHTWLFFLDRVGIGRRLVEALRARGDDVVVVHEGDAFHERSGEEYALAPERGKEGYTALVQALVASGTIPDRVVHLWLLEPEPSVRPGSSVFHHHQERGFFSLFFLAQAIGDEGLPTPLHIDVVENGMQRVEDESLTHPDKATVLGPVGVIPRELPGVSVRAIDVELPEPSDRLFGGTLRQALLDPFGGRKRAEAAFDALAERLFEELEAPPDNEILALREEGRFRLGQRAHRLEALEGDAPRLREGGVYLFTGGLGGIALSMAEDLARRLKAKLVLVARSAIPPRDQWATWMRAHGPHERTSQRLARLLEVEEAGGELVVLSADVTNVDEMRAVVDAAKRRFGAIHGVLHTAGVVDDAPLLAKDQASIEEVFTPKIQGTMVLEEVLEGEPLDFLVLFSSTSVISTPAGQVDYVAANAFLDAYAQYRAGGPTDVFAVRWGIWKDVGMAAAAVSSPEVALGEQVGEQPDHPFLDARVRDLGGRNALSVTLSPETHWLLDEHRTLAGHALVPGTGYLELARAALEAHGETGPFVIEDLFFIRPLAVEDGAKREVRLRLAPNERGYAFEVRGRVALDRGEVGWERHAEAQLVLGGLKKAPAKIDLAAIAARCTRGLDQDEAGLVTPQEKHLRFGPRWRVLREARFGEHEGLADLSLSPAYAEEVREITLHPALVDIATGWAMDLIAGYSGDALWVPVAYERVAFHRPLPARVRSWVRSDPQNQQDADFAYFDVVLADAEGQVCVEVRRLSLRKMTGPVDFAVRGRPAPSELDVEPREETEGEPSQAELALRRNLERGIEPSEGAEALARVLTGPAWPVVTISSLAVDGLVRQASAAAAASGPSEGGIKLSRPELDSAYVEPRDDIERALVGYWQELLGVDQVGVEDSFFDLGGHSLIAVRLFARVKKAFHVEFPISVLFEAPTIARCADLVREAIGDTPTATSDEEARRPRYAHLVAMHAGDGGPKTPFFLVAGMFGNVLNLRHLAALLGKERRFYGLQARGLYGDSEPHETFEEMADAYIAELRTVQPHGPYLLGGFSGGGITAYEMAQQLRRAGEEVALLVMLDTPLPNPPPKLTLADRIKIQTQQFERKGAAYLGEWAQNRLEWEVGKLRRRFEDPEPEQAPAEFQDQAIEAAFRRALDRYHLESWPGHLALFRPKLNVAYDLGPGRKLDYKRDYVFEDNGWTPHVGRLDVHEVPGDHDSMVLEPNVRVLARRLRDAIETAEAGRSAVGT